MLKRYRVFAVTGVQKRPKVGVGTLPSEQVVATSGRSDARSQVEGDGFWELAIHRPYPSLSDAPASLLIAIVFQN
jgi:hypothetical protein